MTIFGSDRFVRPVVVGFGATAIGHHPGRSPSELGLAVLDEALETSGLAAQDVEGRGGMRRESAMLAFKAACQDVALGHLDVAAVIGAQAEATSSTPAWTAATWTGFQASTVRS